MYSLKDIRTLSDYAAELLTNHALCRDIQNNAYVEFKQKIYMGGEGKTAFGLQL